MVIIVHRDEQEELLNLSNFRQIFDYCSIHSLDDGFWGVVKVFKVKNHLFEFEDFNKSVV